MQTGSPINRLDPTKCPFCGPTTLACGWDGHSAEQRRKAFYASVRAIEALCPMCKQPQDAPSCERREHTGAR